MVIETKQGLPVTDDMLDSWAEGFESGDWPSGTTKVLSRPKISDDELVPVTVKIPRSQVEAIDKKSQNRSEFIRMAINSCL